MDLVHVCCLVLVDDNFVSANGKINANSRLHPSPLSNPKIPWFAKSRKIRTGGNPEIPWFAKSRKIRTGDAVRKFRHLPNQGKSGLEAIWKFRDLPNQGKSGMEHDKRRPFLPTRNVQSSNFYHVLSTHCCKEQVIHDRKARSTTAFVKLVYFSTNACL